MCSIELFLGSPAITAIKAPHYSGAVERFFEPLIGQRMVILFVQLIHIDKLGLDHADPKIYIYFANAKSEFYFLWVKWTAQRFKASNRS